MTSRQSFDTKIFLSGQNIYVPSLVIIGYYLVIITFWVDSYKGRAESLPSVIEFPNKNPSGNRVKFQEESIIK